MLPNTSLQAPINKPLNILVVTLDFPIAASQGGYDIICDQVCKWLTLKGHRVTILTSSPRADQTGLLSSQPDRPFNIIRTLQPYWDGYNNLFPHFYQALSMERNNREALTKAVRETQPDVISFWHMGTISIGLISWAAEHLRLPVNFVIGDDWLYYGGWTDGWLRRFIGRPKYARLIENLTGYPTTLPDFDLYGHYCFVSEYIRQRARTLGGWKLTNSRITYPGLDAAEIEPLPFEKAANRSWNWQLLWVGRVIEGKGIRTAIEVLCQLPPQATLKIVGPVTPAYKDELTEYAARLGLTNKQLEFSFATHPAIFEYYRQADVFLFTSLIPYEAFGLTPLEAMVSGCPVITTGIGGSAEYCKDKQNCLYYPTRDSSALAKAINLLSEDKQLRNTLIKAGLVTAVQFTMENQAAQIEHELYKAVEEKKLSGSQV